MPSSTLCQPGTEGCGDCANCHHSVFVDYWNAKQRHVSSLIPPEYLEHNPPIQHTFADTFCRACKNWVEGEDEAHRRTKLHKLNLVEYIPYSQGLTDDSEEVQTLFQEGVYCCFGNYFYCKEHNQRSFTREENYGHMVTHHKRLYTNKTYSKGEFGKENEAYVNNIEGYVCVYCDTGFQKFSDIQTHYRVLHDKTLSQDQHKELFKKYLNQWAGFSELEAEEFRSYLGCICGERFFDDQSYQDHLANADTPHIEISNDGSHNRNVVDNVDKILLLPSGKFLVCKYCINTNFKDLVELTKHLKLNHHLLYQKFEESFDRTDMFQCKDYKCRFYKSDYEAFLFHMAYFHSNGNLSKIDPYLVESNLGFFFFGDGLRSILGKS